MSSEFGPANEPDALPVFMLAEGGIPSGIGFDAELRSQEWLIESESAETRPPEGAGERAFEPKTLVLALAALEWKNIIHVVAEADVEPDQACDVAGPDPVLAPEAEAVERQDGWDEPPEKPDDSVRAATHRAETFPVVPAEPAARPDTPAGGDGEARQASPATRSLENAPPAAKQDAALNAPLAFVLQLNDTVQTARTNSGPAESRAAEFPEAIPPEPGPARSERGADNPAEFEDEPVRSQAPSRGANREPLAAAHTAARGTAPTVEPRVAERPGATTSSERAQETAAILPPEEPARPASVSGIRLRLGGDRQPEVEVSVTARAGQVTVAVRSDDAGLGGALRSQISDLVTSIERNGYRAEALMPPPGAARDSHTPDWSGRREPDPGAGDSQRRGRSGRFRAALRSAQGKGVN